MQLTQHFTLEELYKSDLAIRHGFTNMPSPNIIGNLLVVAQGLEKVRELLGKPINVSSGYRSPRLNTLVKGAKTSAHLEGYAADFACWGYGSPKEIVKVIASSNIQFDQCIAEGVWTHISFAPKLRREVLTAIFDHKGKVHYLAAP